MILSCLEEMLFLRYLEQPKLSTRNMRCYFSFIEQIFAAYINPFHDNFFMAPFFVTHYVTLIGTL